MEDKQQERPTQETATLEFRPVLHDKNNITVAIYEDGKYRSVVVDLSKKMNREAMAQDLSDLLNEVMVTGFKLAMNQYRQRAVELLQRRGTFANATEEDINELVGDDTQVNAKGSKH